MPMNTIHFSGRELAAIYKDHLVEMRSGTEPESPKKNNEWKFLGENRKHILIVTEYKSAVHIPDDMLDFLVRMLKACKLDLGDIALVNIFQKEKNQTGYLLEHFKPGKVILFGAGPESLNLPIGFPQFQVQAFNNTSFLCCPALDQLQIDHDQKKTLWASLQKLFSL